MEKKIRDNAIGYTCEEDRQSIENLIASIRREDLVKMSANAAKLWKDVYSTYTEDYLNNKYVELITL
jgi:hypothetical protein